MGDEIWTDLNPFNKLYALYNGKLTFSFWDMYKARVWENKLVTSNKVWAIYLSETQIRVTTNPNV